MKKLLWILGGLALAGIAVVVAVFFLAKAKLEPLAEKVLTDCSQGKVEQVYAEAAPAFRASASLETFRRYVELRRQALGGFRRIVKTTGGGMASSTSGPSTGRISMQLEYEKGTAEGELEFEKDGDTWRLLSLQVAFDEKLLPPPDRSRLEPLSRELLALYDASSFVALYARFSERLQQAWKADAYEQQIGDLRRKTGKLEEATLRETKEEPDGQVLLRFDLRFEAGSGDAELAWAFQMGEWHLMGFQVHLGGR